MIVLLEGPDGGGKTTLAKKLVEKYNGEYYHCGVVKNIYQLHLDTVRRCMEDDRMHVIDRLYISEYVYGNIFRDGESYDINHFRQTFKHHVVFVQIPYDKYVLHHTHNSEREMFKTNLKDIYDKYTDYFRVYPADYVYNYFNETDLEIK